MSATTYADSVPAARHARVAGVCYLFVIAGGIFAALFVREALFVPGDATATASAIAANEALWRWGIAVHLLYLLPGAAVGVILYRLFKPVHATLALLALVLTISDVAIEALLLASLYVPLGYDPGGRRVQRAERGGAKRWATSRCASSSPAGASRSCCSPASARSSAF